MECDILGAVAPYAARNNITHLSVVNDPMTGEDVRIICRLLFYLELG